MSKAYISGKISDLPMGEVKLKFNEAARTARQWLETVSTNTYIQIVNPINIKPLFGIKIWPCYMITDVIALKRCDTVYFCDDWTLSKGACVEMAFALWWKKTILHEKDVKAALEKQLAMLIDEALKRKLKIEQEQKQVANLIDEALERDYQERIRTAVTHKYAILKS